MKKSVCMAAAVLAMSSTAALAQSAKFTAAWAKDKVDLAEATINVTPEGTVVTHEEIMGTIHVPQQKELLIGVSGVANIVTFTEAKGRNGGFTSEAEAEGIMSLEVRVVPEGMGANCGGDAPASAVIAAPGDLTFASRRQTLSVTVDLDVVDTAADTCTNPADEEYLNPGDCLASYLDIEGDVTVALGLDTTAAHHFNFVAPDLRQGTYDVAACFTGDANVSVTEEEVGDNKSRAYVAIADRMLTVQEVRAVNSDFVIEVD